MIRPIINQLFLKNIITKTVPILLNKKYSDLNPKNEIVSLSERTKLINANQSRDSDLSLMINQEFVKVLDQKLNNYNFKSLAYKQDEINSLIYKIENPFHLFYLYDNYSIEFNPFNLVNLIKKLAYFSRNQNLTENGLFFIPEPINKSLTKQIIKIGPQLESFQCLIILDKLVQLGYKINDYSIKAMLQLLKFHVNDFDLDDLNRCKFFLQRLTINSDGTTTSNEYAENLDKALTLAVQIKLEDLKNVRQTVNLIKNFSSSVSDVNFERIINFVYERLLQKDVNHTTDLVKKMAERNFSHLKLFFKIKKFVMRQNIIDCNELKELHDSFFKLKFYDSEIQDYFIKTQIEKYTTSSVNVEIFNGLLESSIYFVHKSFSLLDFVSEKKLYNENGFSVLKYIFYSALTGYEK